MEGPTKHATSESRLDQQENLDPNTLHRHRCVGEEIPAEESHHTRTDTSDVSSKSTNISSRLVVMGGRLNVGKDIGVSNASNMGIEAFVVGCEPVAYISEEFLGLASSVLAWDASSLALMNIGVVVNTGEML